MKPSIFLNPWSGITRRRLLQSLSAFIAWAGGGGQRPTAAVQPAEEASAGLTRIEQWQRTHDRVFLGGQCWANPMEDWQIRDGWAECLVRSGGRSIHSLTHQITAPEQPFAMSVRLATAAEFDPGAGGGFRIGVRSDLDEVRSNCFAGGGIAAGIAKDRLFLGQQSTPLQAAYRGQPCRLMLQGQPQGSQQVRLTLTATADDGADLGSVSLQVAEQRVAGNVALASQIHRPPRGRQLQTTWRFTDWQVGGAAFRDRPEQQFGPLLWSVYTLSDSRDQEGMVLKLAALTGPLGAEDSHEVELQTRDGSDWKSWGTATLDSDAWVATFRVPHWPAIQATEYRVIYQERHADGSQTPHHWGGTIKAQPQNRPLRLGALTCQNDYAFPYEPVVENLLKLDPDMVYFSGDQLYENHGGFGVIRAPAEPAILNYLRKFYQHGWAFRDVMKDRPTVCIPDDHDVFQGNYWGEGGAAMQVTDQGTSSLGGYIQPVRMVNVVHRTNTAHHPDLYDPTPVKQGMSVYYGTLVYAGVSFAIISDRQWKSGPERVTVDGGRNDHVSDPDFDTATLDKPGLELLGQRQEEFLAAWAKDWGGHTMKVLFSQTLFANVATHHGTYDGYLKADLDSGGWPQTPRNRTIDLLRPSMALHVNGDQHLATLVQYGTQRQRDANWSFCTPAIAVGYQRWWRPDELQMPYQNRPQHGLANTGQYIDGLGNLVYVYAVGNPQVPQARHRYQKAHEKASGFGMVTIDCQARTYHLEAFKFLVDATDGNPDNQFPGWPVTLHQTENRGENRLR